MSTLKKTAIWITLLALVLKLSGFLRESIIANEFGANEYTDGYLLAFTFITLIVAMIANGFNNVFLPMYVKERKENPVETEKNANGILNSTVLLFLGITAVGYFLVPYFVPFVFGNMHPKTEEIAVEITQFFFLFMSAIALNGILESYLQARRVFVPSQISKLLATLMGAIFALLFSNIWGIHSLAYGFIVGTVLGAVIQFSFLLKKGFQWQPTLYVNKDFRKAFIALIIPSLLNSIVGQVNMFIDKTFASGTIEGAVTYLNNASLLVSIPNAIYATTIAAIIFTLLSEQVDNPSKFQNTFFMGLEISLLTLLPIAAGLFVVGDSALSFIYERGAFTNEDTSNTYLALLFYLPLIVTQGLQFIVSKSMYARGKTAIIFRISVTTILVNVIMNYLLVDRMGYAGLALSSSIVAVYYLVVSSVVVYKDFEKSEVTKLTRLIVRSIPPTLIMSVPLYFIQKISWFEDLYSLWKLLIVVPLGAIIYVVSLRIFYREGFNRLLQLLKRRK